MEWMNRVRDIYMYSLAFFINVFLHSTLRAQVFSLPSGQMKAWYKCYIYFWPMATFAVILQLLGMTKTPGFLKVLCVYSILLLCSHFTKTLTCAGETLP